MYAIHLFSLGLGNDLLCCVFYRTFHDEHIEAFRLGGDKNSELADTGDKEPMFHSIINICHMCLMLLILILIFLAVLV
jgi:hypothetical protein